MELVLEICKHVDALSPASTAALAITCRALFSILSSNRRLARLRRKDRIHLLYNLEKDLGENFYLCQGCWRLHRFFPKSGPLDPDWCGSYGLTSLMVCYPYRLSWSHVHLVMNRHRLGGTKGLPLRNLEMHLTSHGAVGGRLWDHKWSAKIIDGELFLRARHTLRGHHEPNLRSAIADEMLHICTHIWMPSGAIARSTISLLPSQRVVGSCRSCLTDYITEIQWLDAPRSTWQRPVFSWMRNRNPDPARQWSITVTAYHQVGDGREIGDWKWTAFTGIVIKRPKVRCEAGDYPPGSVIERWHDIQHQPGSLRTFMQDYRDAVADGRHRYPGRNRAYQIQRPSHVSGAMSPVPPSPGPLPFLVGTCWLPDEVLFEGELGSYSSTRPANQLLFGCISYMFRPQSRARVMVCRANVVGEVISRNTVQN